MSAQPDKGNWMMATGTGIVTCLGVVLDRNMTMAPHCLQAMKGIAVLKYAAQQQVTRAVEESYSREQDGVRFTPG